MSKPKDYESTVMRMAGNIAAWMYADHRNYATHELLAQRAVAAARAIVAEVQRTQPPPEQP